MNASSTDSNDLLKPLSNPSSEEGEGETIEYVDPTPWDWRFFGVYYQYIVLGVFYGTMNPLMYPLFSKLLDLPSYRVKGSMQVMIIWWTFKMFIGCFSDCFPIFGYRRKPYIIVGWSLSVAMVCVIISFGQPQTGDAAWPYVLGFSLVNFFYIVGDVAMDGLVTDLAKREPVERRGKIQSTIYMCRYFAMSFTACLVAFGFSDERYGGNFPWAFDLPDYLLILVVVGALGIYPFYRVEESNHHQRRSYFAQLGTLGKRIQMNAVWRVMLFSFSVHFFAYINNVNLLDIQRQWCHTQPWVEGLFSSVLAQLFMAVGIFFTKKYLLNTSWRKILAICIVLMAVIVYIPAIFYDFGMVRNQFFCVGAPLVNNLALGIFFIVCTFCAVEIAEKGYEGITYGMMTTVGNLSVPFTNVFGSVLSSQFDLYTEGRKLRDDAFGRRQMFYLDTCIFVLNLCALFCLLILPDQKQEIQRLLATGARSKTVGTVVVVAFFLTMCWSTTANFLLSFESTSCLPIVGGRGCKK